MINKYYKIVLDLYKNSLIAVLEGNTPVDAEYSRMLFKRSTVVLMRPLSRINLLMN